MKVLKCSVIILISTVIFSSCRPNGSALDGNVMEGTPTKADTVLPHKYHLNGDSTLLETAPESRRLTR